MESLWLNLLKLNWSRDYYSMSSSKEKAFLWELLCERLSRDETLLQDFQLDRVPVHLILTELSKREDLMENLPEKFLGKYYGFIKEKLKDRQRLIENKKIIQDYGVDIGVDIKVNAIKEWESLEKISCKIREQLQKSSSVRLRMKAIIR